MSILTQNYRLLMVSTAVKQATQEFFRVKFRNSYIKMSILTKIIGYLAQP